MSARGSYEPPVFRIREPVTTGAERRSNDPIRQLGRALNGLCLEAADPFEIAAHLEALGYNNQGVIGKFGVADHFELARELFYLTPRRLTLARPTAAAQRSYTRQAVMALTLLVSLGIGLFAVVSAWAAVIWLLVWSQLGGALLNRASSELTAAEHGKVLSLLLGLGLVGLGSTWFVLPFGPATWSVSLLWLGVAGLLWAERLRAALFLPTLVGSAFLLMVGLELPQVVLPSAVSLTLLALLRPLLRPVPRSLWRWTLTQWRHVTPFIVYGLGQGAVLLSLLGGAGHEALPGLALFAVLLMGADTHLLWLRGRLNLYLWKRESVADYTRAARLTLVRYTALYLLAFVPAGVIFFFPELAGEGALYYLAGFALFGLLLGLGLVSLSLGDSILPALVFAFGGALLLFGLPFFWIVGTMALCTFALLLRRIALLGRYGVYLL